MMLVSILFKTNSGTVTVPISACPPQADLSLGLRGAYPPTFFHRPPPTPSALRALPTSSQDPHSESWKQSSFHLIIHPVLLLSRPASLRFNYPGLWGLLPPSAPLLSPEGPQLHSCAGSPGLNSLPLREREDGERSSRVQV